MRHNKNIYRLILLFIYFLILVLTINRNVDIIYGFVLMIWLSLFIYFLSNWKKNIIMVCYLFCFFTFLLGRETFFRYTKLKTFVIFNNREINIHTYLVLIISLLFTTLGYILFSNCNKKVVFGNLCKHNYSDEYVNALRNVSKYIFFCTYPFLIIKTIMEGIYIHNVGYVESYTAEASGAGVPWIMDKLAMLCLVAFFCLLSSFSPKMEIKKYIVMYGIYGGLTLFTGQRYPVVAVMLVIIIYCVIRDRMEGGWIQKKHYIMLAFAIPLMAVFLLAVDAIRLGETFEMKSFTSSFINFFAGQGGSINVIKYGKYFEERLRDVDFYSINSTLSNIFNIYNYRGNTLEYAMHGHSFAARMTILEYGVNSYLEGHGVGTSFIAELYHDFGYIGVGMGSFVYGWCINKINQINRGKPYSNTFFLLMISPLMFAPRGEFDGFLGVTFRRANLLFVILIFFLVNIIEQKHIKNNDYRDERF